MSVEDVISPGITFTRNCFVCSKNKTALGGRTDKRTRMWVCADCLLTKQEKRNEDNTKGITG